MKAFRWLVMFPIFILALMATGPAALASPVMQVTVLPGGDLTTPTATLPPTATPTDLPPTATPTDLPPTATPTDLPPGYYRPLVVFASYRARPGTITPGANFNLAFKLVNQGQTAANNVVVTFVAGELIPRQNGGVIAVGRLGPGESRELEQPYSASGSLAGLGAVSVEARLSYTDEAGTGYNEAFSLAINTGQPQPTSRPPAGPPGPTPTPTAMVRPQLVIQDTQTDVEILQPGTRFNLALQVVNVGNATARRVTMIAGGATVAPPDPSKPGDNGGVSGSGGEFTNFSPLGASNVQSLGDLPAGEALVASQPLIVNVSTNPGAYSFKISFVYIDDKGNQIVDDQVITLLVFLNPVVEISFYRDPGPLFAGQPNQLPLQIVNLGRKSVVLGNMKVSAAAGQLSNSSVLVGTLETGGYFTLDASLIPDGPGPLELTVTVDYTDDFNQPQSITRALSLEVLEAPIMEPPPGEGEGPGAGPIEPQPETFWQKAARFLRGLVGLDSGLPPAAGPIEPPGEGPPPGEGGPAGPAGPAG